MPNTCFFFFQNSAIVAGPDEKWGERPVAIIVLRNKQSDLTEQDVINHSRASLAGYKVTIFYANEEIRGKPLKKL